MTGKEANAELRRLAVEAEKAHQAIACALEGCRTLLHGAIVMRYGILYKVSDLFPACGAVHVRGLRYYSAEKVGKRPCHLGHLHACQIIEYPISGDAPNAESRQTG